MSKTSAHARSYFDARLERLGLVIGEPRPHSGWVRAIRDALGMSSSELANRMGVGQSTISGLERGELLGTVKLETLRRAASALDCDLVYYLVPRTTLEDTALTRARSKAQQQLDNESQPAGDQDGVGDRAARLDELAHLYLDQRGLWTD